MESTAEPVKTTITLPRFGEFAYSEGDVIEFPWGIPGFSNQHRWLALTLDSQPGYFWLQSLDDTSVAIPAANPWSIFEDYDPKVPSYAFASLDIKGAAEFTMLCVVVVASGGQEMTMNLSAPIVINLRTRMARQVPCDNAAYSSQHRIPRKDATAEAALSAKAS